MLSAVIIDHGGFAQLDLMSTDTEMRLDMQANLETIGQLIKDATKYETAVYVLNDIGIFQLAQIKSLSSGTFIAASLDYDKNYSATSMVSAFNAIGKWLPRGTLYAGSIKVVVDGEPRENHDALSEATLAVWKNVFSEFVDAAPPDDLAPDEEKARAYLLPKLTGGEQGTRDWNSTPQSWKEQVSWEGVNLSQADLEKTLLNGLRLEGASFERANLTQADLSKSKLDKANFHEALLTRANMYQASLKQANFSGAFLCGADLTDATMGGADFRNCDLSNAVLSSCDLTAADLSTAVLIGTKLDRASFDARTKFPQAISIETLLEMQKMTWIDKGLNPVKAALKARLDQVKVETFEQFMEQLSSQFEQSRLKKVTVMLKSERFQLFSQVTPTSISGVVKSQTDKELVYSCRLADSGAYTCCTQNLKACGGLKGSLCKHLLVLLIGLTKTNQLHPINAARWALSSMLEPPKIEKEELADIFLKYKGAEAGEIDWRPTETVPEDYYAL